ncbi:MAG TPA: sugar transferase [Chthonomonadales bacterium]|nr:sugar transferase [Chthonomonadales bacterium]
MSSSNDGWTATAGLADSVTIEHRAEELPKVAITVVDRPATTPQNGAAPRASAETVDPANDTARFGFDYVHPGFKCKQVGYIGLKRLFDIASALILLTLLSPILLIAAIAIKISSRGPILFKQVRVGRGGRFFWCYKLRSMCVDAEDRRSTLHHLNEVTGPVFKIKHDPRMTPVGRMLRKFSLDETPQLYNILKGDMSLVGPRPPIPDEVAHYSEYERGRLAVRPGLTCLWQVSGRSDIPFERWVELDLIYIDTMSFANDLKICLKTIPAVLSGSGAY